MPFLNMTAYWVGELKQALREFSLSTWSKAKLVSFGGITIAYFSNETFTHSAAVKHPVSLEHRATCLQNCAKGRCMGPTAMFGPWVVSSTTCALFEKLFKLRLVQHIMLIKKWKMVVVWPTTTLSTVKSFWLHFL